MNQRRHLLALARKGDQKAVNQLMELYQVRVYSGDSLKSLKIRKSLPVLSPPKPKETTSSSKAKPAKRPKVAAKQPRVAAKTTRPAASKAKTSSSKPTRSKPKVSPKIQIKHPKPVRKAKAAQPARKKVPRKVSSKGVAKKSVVKKGSTRKPTSKPRVQPRTPAKSKAKAPTKVKARTKTPRKATSAPAKKAKRSR